MKKNFILSLSLLLGINLCMNAQTDNVNYERKVLLEEFTTERCPQCPYGATYISGLLNDTKYSDKVIVVAHHAGFHTDWLTTNADEELTFLYNSSSYAPAMMFDRYPFFVDYFSYGSGNPTPLFFFSSSAELKKYVKKRLQVTPNTDFDIKAEYNSNSNNLDVYVSGQRSAEFGDSEARVSVYITEDQIPEHNQQGSTSDYIHEHVMRTCNSTWGEPIIWNNNNFEYQCSINIDNSWKKDNLNIVVFVNEYDKRSPEKCVVDNSRMIPFSDTNSIVDFENDSKSIDIEEYYTLDGRRTDSCSHGIKLKKIVYSDGSQETKKIINN